MAQQRYFAGVPVVGQRRLEPDEHARLIEVVSALRREALGTYAILVAALALVIVVSIIPLPTTWSGFAIFAMVTGLLRVVPTRRLFHPRTVLAAGRDLVSQTVITCLDMEVMLEVLAESHILWTRHGFPVETIVITHSTVTELPPEHATFAANFVQPLDEQPNLLVHQRAMTPEELKELDSYAPRPQFVVLVLAIVGVFGGLLTLAMVPMERVWLPVAIFIVGAIAAIAVWRAHKARRLIAADLEHGYVLIVRTQSEDTPGPPQEFLFHSGLPWTESGESAKWRRQL